MSTTMRLRSLTVVTAADSHTFEFATPLTFVTGTVGMGKSTLLMLIKHALGGQAALTPAVVQHVTHVQLVVQIGSRTLHLRRRIGTDAGAVDVLEPASTIIEQVLPVKPTSADDVSLSRMLLQSADLPDERMPTTKSGTNAKTVAMTFNDVLRYCYLQAKEIDRSVVGHLDDRLNAKRKAWFELMFGLSDAELLALRRNRNMEKDQERTLKRNHEAIGQFIVDAGIADAETLRSGRFAQLAGLRVAERSLDEVRSDVARLTVGDSQARETLAAATIRARDARDAVGYARATVVGRRAALAQLGIDRDKAERSAAAVGLLSPFEFTSCPRCTQPLPERGSVDDTCLLCCQPVAPGAFDNHSDESRRDRLAAQITETQLLLAVDEQNLATAERAAHDAEEQAGRLHADYDAATRAAVSPRLEEVARLATQTESLRNGLREIDNGLELWSRHARLREQAANHKSAGRRLQDAIDEIEERLRVNASRVEDLDTAFKQEVTALGIPIDGEPRIAPDTYLPMVGSTNFENLQASGGGASTALNVAYHLALLLCGVDDPNILIPDLLIIDSPRKAIGDTDADRQLGNRIYERIKTIADSLGPKIQIIVADNNVPNVIGAVPTIQLTSERATVPGVTNAGLGTGRVEDIEDADT